jgi:tRNA1(Val) A37 N6-methylase TrmN6
MEGFFPDQEGVDRTRLRIHEVGRYSISLPRDAEENVRTMAAVLARLTGKDACELHVTDACACVGGDTIALAKHFARVTAVEVDRGTHDILTHNLRTYGLLSERCEPLRADCVELFRDPAWRSDVVYIDPPWNQAGRPWHTQLASVMPQLSGRGVEAVASELLGREGGPVMVVLKCPWNFDFTRLCRAMQGVSIVTHKVNKYFLVCCTRL